MVKPEDIEKVVGKHVTVRLSPRAPGTPLVTGTVLGVLRALDGLVVTLAPDGEGNTPRTFHYHFIEGIEPS